MKLIAIIALTIFLNTCGNKNVKDVNTTAPSVTTDLAKTTTQNKDDLTLQYTEETRGAFKQVTVTKDTIAYQLQRGGDIKTQPISKSQWKNLLSLLEKTNINSFSELKAPSNKRMTDAALIARLQITKDGKTYSSPDFDHDNPIAEIKDIVNSLLELGNLRTKN